MVLYHSSEMLLTFCPSSDTLHFSYTAPALSAGFGEVYQLVIEQMRANNVGRLLLDLKRNAPSTDDLEPLFAPLNDDSGGAAASPLFIAALVSEGQYQHQVGSSLASCPLPPAQVEFNYFTSRRDATRWLSES